MQITRKSIMTGITRITEMDITPDQLERIDKGEYVQNVVPNLSIDDREFLISGITKEEWAEAFGEE